MNKRQKINAIYKLIHKLLTKPKSIFWILKDETEFEDYISKKYHRTQFPTVDLQHFLSNSTINNYTFLDGSSLITDLALLKSIAQNIPDCQYLEIGTWRGESILNVIDAGAKCTSINLSPEQIIEMGIDEKYAHLHGCLIKNPEMIETIYADSLKFDFSSLKCKYDLIFVDGDHSYEAVKSDSSNVFNLLKDDNSMIVWHDYAYNPETPRHSVIAAILDGMPVNEHKHLYHVSNTLCAIYTKKNLKTYQQTSPVKPTKTFKITFQINPFEI